MGVLPVTAFGRACLRPSSHSANLRIKFTPFGARTGVSVNAELLNLCSIRYGYLCSRICRAGTQSRPGCFQYRDKIVLEGPQGLRVSFQVSLLLLV